jgi:hypothetical protein
MIIFYGDESGCHGKGDYVLSGYLAHKDTWDLFTANWRRFLASEFPKRIGYLKMSEWEHRTAERGHTGQFLEMDDWDASIRLDSLTELLCTFLKSGGIAEYTASISWDIYKKHVTGHCREVFDDPYYFLLMHIVKMSLDDLKRASPSFSDKIHFVFDAGNSAERHAQKHFSLLKKFSSPERRKYIGALTFEDDKECPPLQAADMIAWYTRRAMAGFPKDEDGSRRRRYEKLHAATRRGMRGEAMADLLTDFSRDVNTLTEDLASGRAMMVVEDDD